MNRIEEWRRIILSINDNTFFDLMRNYLGRIDTPFNKQELMDRLVNFLTRNEIRRSLLSLIDRDDARILTAVALSDGATENRLRSSFPDFSYLQMLNRIGNLEERFLIYREKGIYRLTPLFEKDLKDQIVSPALLIKTEKSSPGFDPPLWFNDSLILALYAFLNEDSDLIKIDGSVKKRCSTKLEELFPNLYSGKEGLNRFYLTLKILKNLNLVTDEEGVLRLNREEWKRLAFRSEKDRYILYYGAALSDSPAGSASMTDFFMRFYSSFPRNRSMERDSLDPFFMIFCKTGPGFRPNEIKESLTLLNILVPAGSGLKMNGILSLNESHSEQREEPLIVQPNFEITVKPTAALPSLISVLEVLDLVQYDLYTRYKLSKKSFLRAFGKGFTASKVIMELEELSGKELSQNIRISLNDWAEDYEKVTLYKGTIMKVSEDKRILIEKTDMMKPYISEELAKGIYLLKPGFDRQWAEAMEALSINPRVIDSEEIIKEKAIPNPLLEKSFVQMNETGNDWSIPETVGNGIEDIPENINLFQALEQSQIKGDEKKEIEARINRKLIFHPSQINKGIVRPELNEARGMNYHGKVRLVEAALQNSSDRLELSYFSGGDSISLLVKPLELKKDKNDRILEGRILPDDEPIAIRVSKISRIRKIRSSLF